MDTDALADLPGFDTEALDKMAQRLVDFERWISERRHVVQGVVDTLQAEIALTPPAAAAVRGGL